MSNHSVSTHLNIQSSQNFTKTSSTLSVQSFIPTSPSNSENQKLFHRKPSFKFYERKQKKQPDPQNKICYISPQKSQIFKKFTPYRPNHSQLNSSFVTNNSSEISNHYDNRKSFKTDRPSLQVENSRTVFNEINNVRKQQPFRTPKNIKNDQSFFMSPSNPRRMSLNQLKMQDSMILSQIQTNFDKDFESLISTKNPQYQLSKKPAWKWFQRKGSQQNIEVNQDQERKQGQIRLLNMQLNILKDSLEKLNQKYGSMETQKNQLQQSSKIFLTEIKNLQDKNEKLQNQNEKAHEEISKLKVQLSQKNIRIKQLENKLSELQRLNLSTEVKCDEQEISQKYKALYFEVNEKLKYKDVQNSILKKILDEKKDDQRKTQRLEAANKKLISKNKLLLKEIGALEEQLQNLQLQTNSKKPLSKDFTNRKVSKSYKNQEISLKNVKAPPFLLNKVSLSPRSSQKSDKSQGYGDSIFENQIVSSGSLQFSFQLSPQKNYQSSRFKDQKQDLSFRTPNKCFN